MRNVIVYHVDRNGPGSVVSGVHGGMRGRKEGCVLERLLRTDGKCRL